MKNMIIMRPLRSFVRPDLSTEDNGEGYSTYLTNFDPDGGKNSNPLFKQNQNGLQKSGLSK